MGSDVNSSQELSLIFRTKLTAPEYQLADAGPYVIPASSARDDLDILLKGLLELEVERPVFDFRVNNLPVRLPLAQLLQENELSTELTIEVEYFLLWTSNEPQVIQDTPSPVIDMAKVDGKLLMLCANGSMLLRDHGSNDEGSNVLQQWTVPSDVPLCLLPGHPSGGAQYILSKAGEIYSVDTTKATEPHECFNVATESPFTVAAVNGDRSMMALGCNTGDIVLVRLEPLWKEGAGKARAKSSKKRAADGSPQGKTVENLTVARVIPQAHIESVTGLAFYESVESRTFYLLSAGLDKAVRVWDYLDGTKEHGFDTPAAVTSLACGGDKSSSIITGHIDGRVRLWNLQNITMPSGNMILVASWAAHSRVVHCLLPHSEDDSIIASASNDQRVSVIDLTSRNIPLCMQAVPSDLKYRRQELPVVPSAALWWTPRRLLVGTSHCNLLEFNYA